MRTRTRGTSVAVTCAATLVTAGLLAGCGEAAEQVAEEAVEQAAEGQMGGDVEIDADDDSITVEGEDGSEFSVGNDELPEDFPTDIPIPDGGTVESASTVKTDGKAGWFVTMSYPNADAALLADDVKETMEDAGFEEESTFSADDSTTASYSGNKYTVNVVIGPGMNGDGTSLSLTVSEK